MRVFSDGDDHSGAVGPQGHRRFDACGQAAAHVAVHQVDAGHLDFDEGLTRGQFGDGLLLDAEDVGRPERESRNDAHDGRSLL
ncbi:hypothetical protein ACWGQ5_52145 [Streptomyces sp. NPDC055722]